MTPDIFQQLGLSVGVAGLLEYLKRASWFPWLSAQTSQANRYLSVVAAFLMAVGIHWEGDFDPAAGVFVLTVGGLTMQSVWHAVLDYLQQWGTLKLAYKVAIKNNHA